MPVIYLTSGTTWTVPFDWNNSNNYVICWGGGGGGRSATAFNSAGGGGGGGGCSIKNNIALTPLSSVSYSVGAAGAAGATATAGGDTWFVSTGTVLAKGGSPGTTLGGAGGNIGNIGDVVYAGGAGGNSTSGAGGGGGGGGGNSGAGGAGGTATTSTTGGNGGAGGAPAGGAGGTSTTSTGGAGSNGGAGGGGAGGSVLSNRGYNGGAAGLWGGGGGGGAGGFLGSGVGGAGAQGLIAIVYTAMIYQLQGTGSISMNDINVMFFTSGRSFSLNDPEIKYLIQGTNNPTSASIPYTYNPTSTLDLGSARGKPNPTGGSVTYSTSTGYSPGLNYTFWTPVYKNISIIVDGPGGGSGGLGQNKLQNYAGPYIGAGTAFQYWTSGANGSAGTRATYIGATLSDAEIVNGVLTVYSVSGGNIMLGAYVYDPSNPTAIAGGIRITAFGTGTGGAGTYTLSSAITVSRRSTIVAAYLMATPGTGGAGGNRYNTVIATSGTGYGGIVSSAGTGAPNRGFPSPLTSSLYWNWNRQVVFGLDQRDDQEHFLLPPEFGGSGGRASSVITHFQTNAYNTSWPLWANTTGSIPLTINFGNGGAGGLDFAGSTFQTGNQPGGNSSTRPNTYTPTNGAQGFAGSVTISWN